MQLVRFTFRARLFARLSNHLLHLFGLWVLDGVFNYIRAGEGPPSSNIFFLLFQLAEEQ
jgi:hypothetical protein